MLSLSRSDVVWYCGDSLRAGFGGSVPVQGSTGRSLTGAASAAMPPIAAPFVPPLYKWPRFVMDALAGRAATDIGASMAAELAKYNACSAAIIALGINDADKIRQSLETVNQFSVAQLQIVDALNTTWGIPYAKMLWVGGWAHDSGDDDVANAQVNAQCVTNASLRGFTFLQVSQIPNTPLGTMTIGDGTHPLQPASDLLGAAEAGQIRLTA